jgi:hypothetical protein
MSTTLKGKFPKKNVRNHSIFFYFFLEFNFNLMYHNSMRLLHISQNNRSYEIVTHHIKSKFWIKKKKKKKKKKKLCISKIIKFHNNNKIKFLIKKKKKKKKKKKWVSLTFFNFLTQKYGLVCQVTEQYRIMGLLFMHYFFYFFIFF